MFLQAAGLLQLNALIKFRADQIVLWKVKIYRSMIKRYNESDYNLQLRFLVSLRSSERDRKYHEFLFLFLFIFLPETESIVTFYDDKSY